MVSVAATGWLQILMTLKNSHVQVSGGHSLV